MSDSQPPFTDSMHAMQSLLTAYADNEGDDDVGADDSTEQHPGANFISDDEEEHHSDKRSKDEKPTNSSSNDKVHNSEKDPTTDSPSAKRPKLQHAETVRSTTRLVSYLDDDMDEEADSSNSGASDDENSPPPSFGSLVPEAPDNVIVRNGSAIVLDLVQTEALVSNQEASVPSPNAAADNEIVLPPEASGKCSKRLQEKVEKLYDKMLREGRDLNYEIQKRKDFRNPSIYEKIIEFCGIDEKGTNYPPELYHPDNWVLDENSYYDKLAQAQADLMQKKEKEAKKSKVERQIGIKKTASEPSALSSKHP